MFFSRVLTSNRESTGTFLKDPGISKRSISNKGEMVWCDTFNAWAVDHVILIGSPATCFTSLDLFYVNQKSPFPQTCHFEIIEPYRPVLASFLFLLFYLEEFRYGPFWHDGSHILVWAAPINH